MQQGKIKLLTNRGFGFIALDDSDEDLFFHSSELKNARYGDLEEGDAVSFETTEGPKGSNAVNVSKIEE